MYCDFGWVSDDWELYRYKLTVDGSCRLDKKTRTSSSVSETFELDPPRRKFGQRDAYRLPNPADLVRIVFPTTAAKNLRKKEQVARNVLAALAKAGELEITREGKLLPPPRRKRK